MRFVTALTLSWLFATSAIASEFGFTPTSFIATFNKTASDPSLSAVKEGCHNLSAGGIECRYKINPILSLHVSALDENSPARSVTLMGGIAKDDPRSPLRVMMSAATISEIVNPEQPKEARGQAIIGMIKEVTSKAQENSSAKSSRNLGNVNYNMMVFSGILVMSAKPQ